MITIKHQPLGTMVFIYQYNYRDLQNWCQGAIKLFWWFAMAQLITKILVFSFNLLNICTTICSWLWYDCYTFLNIKKNKYQVHLAQKECQLLAVYHPSGYWQNFQFLAWSGFSFSLILIRMVVKMDVWTMDCYCLSMFVYVQTFSVQDKHF